MATLDFVADEQAATKFDFQPEESAAPQEQLAPFEPPASSPIRAVTLPEQLQGDVYSQTMREPGKAIGLGFSVAGRALRGGLADLGTIMLRPVTDEMYPEQAVSGTIPDPFENLKAAVGPTSEPLPAQNLASLPRPLQFAGGAAGGLIETVPKMAAVSAMQAAGVPAPIGAGLVFGQTEEGFDPKQAAIAAALPFIGRLSGGTIGAVAKRLGVESATALNWMKGVAGTAGPAGAMLAQGEHEISKLPAAQREQARINLWESLAGQAALGPMGVKFEKKGTSSTPLEFAGAKGKAGTEPTLTHEDYADLERKALEESEKLGSPATSVDEFTGQTADEPFAGQFMRPTDKGMEIRKGNFRSWLETIPKEKRADAVLKRVLEEHIHRHTPGEDAASYFKTLTPLERAIEHRAYTGEWSPQSLHQKRGVTFSDTQLGHEAIRRRMQRLMGGTTSEIAEAALRERWTLKSLDALSDLVRNVREVVGTSASKEGLKLLSTLDDNLKAATAAISSQQPGAFQKDTAAGEKEASRVAGMAPDEFATWAKSTGRGATGAGYDLAKQIGEQGRPTLEKFAKQQEEETTAALDRMRGAKPEQLGKFFAETAQRSARKQFFDEGLRLLDAGKDVQAGMTPEQAAQKHGVGLEDVRDLASQAPAAFQKDLPLSAAKAGEERPSAVEMGAKPYTAITARELEQSGAEHLQTESARVLSEFEAGKAVKPTTFKDYREAMQGKYGYLKPGQLYESYQDALYKRLLAGTGRELEAMAKSVGVKANRISDVVNRPQGATLEMKGATPEARQQMQAESKGQTQRERYRNLIIGRIAEKMLSETAPEAKPTPRSSISPEDLRQNDSTKEPGFVDVSQDDLKHPEILAQWLVQDARRSNRDPVTLTKRLTALMDKQTGRVYLVSTYPHGRSGAMLLDPSVSTIKAHRGLSQLLGRYRPVASMLLDEPVQNFKQSFDSLGDFEAKLGTDARRASQQTFEAPLKEGEQPEPGSWEKGGPITNAEAGAILDHVTAEVGRFDSVDDVKASLSALKEDTNFQALSGYRKLAAELLRRNPELSDEGLINQLAQNIYENHQTASDYETFVKRTMDQGGAEDSPSATLGPITKAPEAVSGARELTLPRFARKSVPREPMPPKVGTPRGTIPAKDSPAAFDKAKAAAKEQFEITAGDIKTILSRRNVKQEIPALLDGADNASRQVAINAKNAIIVASSDKLPPGVTGRAATNAHKAIAKEGTQRRKAAIPYIAAGRTDAQGNWTANKSKIIDWRAKLDIAEAKARAWTTDLNPLKRREGRRWLAAVKEMQAGVDYAETHWSDRTFVEGAQQYRSEIHDAITFENLHGSTTVERDNYIPGLFHGDYFAGKRLLGTKYRMPKKFQNPYDAIAAGPYYLASQDVANLADTRILAGRRSVERMLWTQALTGLNDPATGKPVAKQPVMAMKNVVDPATGLTTKEPVWQSPSPEYELVFARANSKPIAVHRGFQKLVRTLIRPSVIEDLPLGKEALATTGALKHGVLLLFDSFHLARLGQYGKAIAGKDPIGYRGGHSALSYRTAELPRAVERGYISQAAADWAMQAVELTGPGGRRFKVARKAVADELLKQGLNASKITDALYKDAVQNIPIIGEAYHKLISPYNRFLFDRFLPGMMLENAVRSLETASKAKPNTPLPQLARDVIRDINTIYGNMGRQGIFRSATFRDLAQLVFLAPMWQEGLIRKEFSGAARLASLPFRGAAALAGKELPYRQGLPALGTTGKMMATGLATYFIATQLINLITRKQLTFQNEEEDHKFDAFIPIGEKGVWLSPMAVFAETTHDFIRLGETKPQVFDRIVQMGENRLGPIGKMVNIFLTGKAPTGERYSTTGGRLRGGLAQITPGAGAVPITIGTPLREAGHALFPNTIAPNIPGALPKQLLASGAGIKVQAGQSDLNQAYRLARDFMEREGLKKDTGWQQVMTDDPSYTQLRRQLRNGDKRGAVKTFAALQKTHTDKELIKAMKLWAKHPLTGSQKNERLFLQSLSDKELEVYTRANEERQELLNTFYDFINAQP